MPNNKKQKNKSEGRQKRPDPFTKRMGPGGQPPSKKDIEKRKEMERQKYGYEKKRPDGAGKYDAPKKEGSKSLEDLQNHLTNLKLRLENAPPSEKKLKPMYVKQIAATKKKIQGLKNETQGAGKMPDGYNMRRPAEKLGYIQKLGAARMAPGHKGDMTAMKMMHGDAAAKYYDGAGMYMNGAPKYEGASKSYMGAMKHIDGSETKGHETSASGNVSFNVDKDKGATLKGTSTSSKGGSTSSNKVVDKGEDVFYNNLISSKKDMSEMMRQGIDPKNKKAVLNYGNTKAKNMKGSSTSESFSESNPTTVKGMESASRNRMAKILGQDNLKRYGGEMLAKADSISFAENKIPQLMRENPKRDKVTMDAIFEVAGRGGNEAANIRRKKENLPLVRRKGGGFGDSRGSRQTGFVRDYGGGQVFQLKDSQKQSGISGAKGTTGREATEYIKGIDPKVYKAKYKREGSLFTDIDETLGGGGSPKMPKGPMKFGMKK